MEEKDKIKILIQNFPYIINFFWDRNKIKEIIKNLISDIRKDLEIFIYKKYRSKYILIEYFGDRKEELKEEIDYINIPFKEEPYNAEQIFDDIKNAYIFPFYGTDGTTGFIGVRDFKGEIEETDSLILYLISFLYEISDFQEKVEEIVSKDDLTELKNSKFFLVSLRKIVSLKENLPVTVIFMDLDNFKEINDVHGHFVGGKVLQKIGEFLKTLFSSSDFSFAIISRYGGDEFAFLLPKTDLEEGVMVANMVRENLEEYEIKISDTLKFKINASFGVASFPVSTDKPEKLLVLADKALFEAKKTGKNKVFSIPPLEKL